LGPKLTAEMISDTDSATQVKRYIRLTNLIPELLDMMDEGKIAFSVGVELSFLDDQLQYDVLNACELNDNTPSYAQAVRMHKAYTVGELDRYGIDAIMCEEKANQRETVKIPADRLKGKIPGSFNEQQRQDFIVKAVEHYHRYLQRQRDAR
ncbi:MAG: chromosome partitioning protein ParB, partial [Clostridia bacterium]|nr:chromosome partitioning protein ParB [Clostridia bacterium]